jgi:hypothetical protein
MATPDATFFVFLFRLFPISSFYHKCNSSPSLKNYKRGGREHLTKTDTSLRHASLRQHTHPKGTWDLFLLSKACNPYYEHFGVRQHEQQ